MIDLVDQFCTWYHDYNDISAGRAADQRRQLTQLQDFVAGPVQDLTTLDLEQFLASRGDLKPSTILKHLKMIRPFLRWMRKHGELDAERYLALLEVKAPRGAGAGEPRPYTRGQIAEFWEHFDQTFPWTADSDEMRQTPARAEMFVRRWQRNASAWAKVYPYARRLQAEAIVALALYGGLRRNEIFRLDLDDMHYDNAYVNVHGARKNVQAESIDRAVPMPKTMRAALANWIEFRAQVLKPEHDRPWLNLWRDARLEPMTESVLAHLLDKVGDGYSLHRMRHTFGTERYRAGMKIEILREVMGHAHISMTLRYAKISTEDVVRDSEATDDVFTARLVRSHPVLLPEGAAA